MMMGHRETITPFEATIPTKPRGRLFPPIAILIAIVGLTKVTLTLLDYVIIVHIFEM
jgi:hypothetical protein